MPEPRLRNIDHPERQTPPEKPESQEKEEKSFFEESQRFTEGVSEVVEGIESAEGVEFTEGKVSEQVKEQKKGAPVAGLGGQAAAAQGDFAAQQLPKIDVMRVQIATRVKKEIVALEKQAKKMMNNPAKFSPFHLTQVIARIRVLREILAHLAYATAEVVKGWWVKYVKGFKS